MIDPNLAFGLSVLGALGVYIEFVRPGTILPGFTGCILLAFGAYSLSKYPVTRLGLALIGAAALLFLAEVAWNTRFTASLIAIGILSAGSANLLSGRARISALAGCSLSILFGGTSAVLATAARQARRNKWADLPRSNMEQVSARERTR